MTTLSSGDSITFPLSPNQSVTVTSSPGATGSIKRTQYVEGESSKTDVLGPPETNQTYGPYGSDVDVELTSTSGAFTYVVNGNPYVSAAVNASTGRIAYSTNGVDFQIQSAMMNFPTYVAYGNSIAGRDAAAVISTDTYQYAKSPIVWANQLLSGALYGLTNCGYSGQTSDVILSNLSAVTAQKPKYAICFIPENDIATGVSSNTGLTLTSADTISNMTAIVKGLLAAGIIPIIGTPLVSLSYTTQAKADHFHAVAAFTRALPYTYPGVRVFEASDLYVDLTATYPQPASGWTDASAHPTNKACQLIGERIAAQLYDVAPLNPFLSHYNASNAGVAGLHTNPFMAGTTGTVGSNAAGQFPTGLTGSSTRASGTATGSLVARTDGIPGQWAQVAYSGPVGGAQGDYAQIGSTADKALPTGIAIGDTVQCFLEFDMDSSPTNFLGAAVMVRVSPTMNVFGSMIEVTSEYTALPKKTAAKVLVTPPFQIKADSAGLRVYGRAYASAASAAFTCRFGRVAFRKIS